MAVQRVWVPPGSGGSCWLSLGMAWPVVHEQHPPACTSSPPRFHLGRLLVAVFNTLVLFGQAKPRVRLPPLLHEAAVPPRLPTWHSPVLEPQRLPIVPPVSR